jgi:hypothetical protein
MEWGKREEREGSGKEERGRKKSTGTGKENGEKKKGKTRTTGHAHDSFTLQSDW